jgi:aminoglycoside phosphotransferase (APT) family kinase protein
METSEAVARIQSAFPDFPVESVAYEGEGDFCVAYTANGEWVFRFARNAEAARSLQCEAVLLPQVAPTLNLPVPIITHFGTERTGNLAVAGHRKIVGQPLTRELFLGLTVVQQERCARDLAAFLRTLHSFDRDAALRAGVPECSYPFCRTEQGITPGTAVEQYRRELQKLLSFPEVLGVDLAAFCAATVERLVAIPSPLGPDLGLVHGDLSEDHILFDPAASRIAGIIDFTDVVLTDPCLDLMYLYSAYGESCLDLVLAHYDPDRREAIALHVHLLYTWYSALRLLWPLEHNYPAAVEPRLNHLRSLMHRWAR